MSENRSKTVVIIALCLTLIFMGVGFAALTESLSIKTNGTVAASTWKVELTDWTPVEGQKVGGEQVTASVSDVSTTAVTLNFNLSKPGDKVVFTGNIHNGGSLNAKLNKAVEISEFFGEDETVKRTKKKLDKLAKMVPEVKKPTKKEEPKKTKKKTTKEETKKTEPKKVESTKEEPKKVEPKKTETKKVEVKKEEPKKKEVKREVDIEDEEII